MHTAYLLDRFVQEDGTLVIRAQTAAGAIVDVRVAPDMRERAAAIPGRGVVRYQYRGGGRAIFTGGINDLEEDSGALPTE